MGRGRTWQCGLAPSLPLLLLLCRGGDFSIVKNGGGHTTEILCSLLESIV